MTEAIAWGPGPLDCFRQTRGRKTVSSQLHVLGSLAVVGELAAENPPAGAAHVRPGVVGQHVAVPRSPL